jgi:hypothetical protein
MVRFAIIALFLLGFTAPVMGQDVVPVIPVDPQSLQLRPTVPAPERPKALIPLYVSFGTLQAIDVHSTARALERGAVESNPIMKGFAGNTASLTAVKVGGAAVAIYATERLWKRNRAAAIGFMVAANAGMAWVVQHNYRAVR